MSLYVTDSPAVPVELTQQEIKALLEAVREIPYYADGQTSATTKLREALKAAGA